MPSAKNSSKENGPDRRAFARLPIKQPLRFLEVGRNKENKAQTLDISASGIGFICNKALSPNTLLKMWLDMPNGREPISMTGNVSWSQRSSNIQEWRIGVIFKKVNLVDLGRFYYRNGS